MAERIDGSKEARSGVDASLFSVTSPGCCPPDELVSSVVISIYSRRVDHYQQKEELANLTNTTK